MVGWEMGLIHINGERYPNVKPQTSNLKRQTSNFVAAFVNSPHATMDHFLAQPASGPRHAGSRLWPLRICPADDPYGRGRFSGVRAVRTDGCAPALCGGRPGEGLFDQQHQQRKLEDRKSVV